MMNADSFFSTENILSSDRFPIHINTLMSKLTDSNPYISLLSHLVALGLVRKLSGEHQLEIAHKIIDTMKLEQLSGIDALSQEENTHEVSSAINCFDFTLTKKMPSHLPIHGSRSSRII